MLNMLSGGAGAAFIVAALLVIAVLEVIDQRTAPEELGQVRGGGREARLRVRALRAAVVLLVLAAIAATVIRVFVVVR
jgi:hypothetical protein